MYEGRRWDAVRGANAALDEIHEVIRVVHSGVVHLDRRRGVNHLPHRLDKHPRRSGARLRRFETEGQGRQLIHTRSFGRSLGRSFVRSLSTEAARYRGITRAPYDPTLQDRRKTDQTDARQTRQTHKGGLPVGRWELGVPTEGAALHVVYPLGGKHRGGWLVEVLADHNRVVATSDTS